MKIAAKRGLVVREGPRGRGVFATRFAEGETVEVCPTVEISEGGGDLADYLFESTTEGMFLVVLGFGMLYNHSADPNLDYFQDEPSALEFVAQRRIEQRRGADDQLRRRVVVGARRDADLTWIKVRTLSAPRHAGRRPAGRGCARSASPRPRSRAAHHEPGRVRVHRRAADRALRAARRAAHHRGGGLGGEHFGQQPGDGVAVERGSSIVNLPWRRSARSGCGTCRGRARRARRATPSTKPVGPHT